MSAGPVITQEALLARLEIDALIAEFAYRIDHNLSDSVADLFTEDGWYGRHGGSRAKGHAAIRRAYLQRAEQGERIVRHIFTNLRLTMRSSDEADGICILTLFGGNGPGPHPAEPVLVQDYTDTYRRVGGVWLFGSREARLIFAAPNFKPVLDFGKA